MIFPNFFLLLFLTHNGNTISNLNNFPTMKTEYLWMAGIFLVVLVVYFMWIGPKVLKISPYEQNYENV